MCGFKVAQIQSSSAVKQKAKFLAVQSKAVYSIRHLRLIFFSTVSTRYTVSDLRKYHPDVPSTFPMLRSILATHDAHVIPVTFRWTVSISSSSSDSLLTDLNATRRPEAVERREFLADEVRENDWGELEGWGIQVGARFGESFTAVSVIHKTLIMFNASSNVLFPYQMLATAKISLTILEKSDKYWWNQKQNIWGRNFWNIRTIPTTILQIFLKIILNSSESEISAIFFAFLLDLLLQN